MRLKVKVRVSRVNMDRDISVDVVTSNYVEFLHIQIKLFTKPSCDDFVLTLNDLHLKTTFNPNGKMISSLKASS